MWKKILEMIMIDDLALLLLAAAAVAFAWLSTP